MRCQVPIRASALAASGFTYHPFDLAYQAAEAFTEALQHRTRAAGFMKTMLLQRICSSFASGRSTAERMLRRDAPSRRRADKIITDTLTGLTSEEADIFALS